MYESPQDLKDVRVIDVKMPFLSMVVFMVKWAIASIPALIILFAMSAILVGMLGGFLGGISGAHHHVT